MGEAFVAKQRNVVAVRQTVANTSGEPRTVTLGLAYTAPWHERIQGAWHVVKEKGCATWKMTAYGRFVTKETITVQGAGGPVPEAKAVGLDGLVQHTVTLAPGERRTADWFVAFDDDLARTLRTCGDYIHNRFGLGKGQLSVKKSPFCEFAGPCGACSGRKRRPKHPFEQRRTSVAAEFYGVFSGIAFRRKKNRGNRFVNVSVGIEHSAIGAAVPFKRA